MERQKKKSQAAIPIFIYTQSHHNDHFTMNLGATIANDKVFPESNKAFFVDFVQHSKYLSGRILWPAHSLSPAQLDIYFCLFVFIVRVCVRACNQVCSGVSVYFRLSSSFSNFTCFTTNYSILFESLENNFIGHKLLHTLAAHTDFR